MVDVRGNAIKTEGISWQRRQLLKVDAIDQ